MGLNAHHLTFLLSTRALGVDFSRPLMIGRQQFFIDVPSLRRVMATANLPVSDAEAERLLTEADSFADPLLRLLGAATVDAMDASAYEGATIVHDLNAPISDTLAGRYSVVLDSGSLEHVFNFPVAVANCLEMVAEGGHFVAIVPANNCMGHGFYQFSPELFYRVLSPDNGYRVVRMAVVELTGHAWDEPWYEVRDPAVVGHRVEWRSTHETHLMVCARRERVVRPFSATPQQSDYTTHWTENADTPPASVHGGFPLWPPPEEPPSLVARVWRRVPQPIRTVYRRLRGRDAFVPELPDPECFSRVTPHANGVGPNAH